MKKKKIKREINLLLLGPGESGKSTIAKQLRLIHSSPWTEPERREYKVIIISNVVKSIKDVIEATNSFGYKLSEENQKIASTLLDIKNLTHESADLFRVLLKDPVIQQTLDRSSEFLLKDSAPYFFSEIDRIASPDYVPSDADILRSRKKTTSVAETFFEVDRIKFKVIDVGGQKSQRKKWMHLFQDVNAVIFCVSLSGYNLQVRETREISQFTDCLELWEEIINNRWFINTPVILFFNKSDLFKEKLSTVPLTVCFPDYKGENDYEEAINFIKRKFLAKSRNPDKLILSHITCATDSSCIAVVFKAVRTFILNQVLTSE